MKRDPTEFIISLIIIMAFLLGMIVLVPVKKQQAIVVEKDWQTWTELREDYTDITMSCSPGANGGVSCRPSTERKTRTLYAYSLSGRGVDPVTYPPLFEVSGNQYNWQYGQFFITYKQDDGMLQRILVSDQGRFEKGYAIGLECTIKLNIYGKVVSDGCVANGR